MTPTNFVPPGSNLAALSGWSAVDRGRDKI